MLSRTPLAITALAMALSPSFAGAQQLVRDIAQGGVPPSSQPRNFLTLPAFTAFVAHTEDTGDEPWITDGTAAGTRRLLDAVPGSGTSGPVFLCEFQGRALLRLAMPGLGARLFSTDGTAAGTTLIAPFGIDPTSFVRLANGRLLAIAGLEVFATDLTPAGTQLIPGMRRFVQGVAVGGTSYGTCENANGTFDLWATDGTVAGSRLIANVPTTARPGAFTPWNGRVYFQEGVFAAPGWIASTDGVAGYTRHVMLPPLVGGASDRMFVRGNHLVFARGTQLVSSDLTAAGTVQLAVPCTDVGNVVEFGGRLYFRATTANEGYELWTTDGTALGTALVADLLPGPAGAHPEHLLATPAGLVFRAMLTQGRRLLRLSSASSIVDLGAIPDDAPSNAAATSIVSGLIPAPNGGLLFAGTDPTGNELWHFDGSAPPARLLDLNPTAPGLMHASTGPRVAIRDRMFFTAFEPGTGLELWSSDGTTNGTQVLDLTAGAASEFDPLTGSFARLGDGVAFASRRRVGLTDGTVANTVPLTPVGPGHYYPCKVAGEHVYFLRFSMLHRSDGTPAGTGPLPFPQTNSVFDYEILPARIVLWSGSTFYGTDGVAMPQWLGLQGFQPKMHRIAEDRVVITASDGIFVTDGTPAGTIQLATFQGTIARTSVGRGVAWILAATQTGFGLWRSDGTPAGTSLEATLPATLTVDSLVATENALFAVATTAATGRELWRFDAPSAQFVLVADFTPGIGSGVQSAVPLGDGDLLFVAAGDAAGGIEPHVSDGTAAGTVRILDLNPGIASSNPALLGIADDQVFFIADDGVHGSELWVMPLGTTQAASVQNYGLGCPGIAGFPRLTAPAVPHPGLATFALELDRAPALGPVLLGLADDHGVGSLGSCEFLLAGTIATRLGFANLAGHHSFLVPLPATTQLIGLRFTAQGFALDGSVVNGFTTSDGVIFVPGL